MKRLAEYMTELARLFGESDHVHFAKLARGSAKLLARVQYEAVPKVRERLSRVADGLTDDLTVPFRRIDKMLAADNATGEIVETGRRGVVVRFPGVKGASAIIGPITEDGVIVGEILRVGGEDETAHVRIRDDAGTYSCTISRELAQRLGRYLYKPVKLAGRGRWLRLADGTWRLEDFKATDFTPVQEEGLRAIMDKLKPVGDAWDEDGVAEIARLRRAE
ncbi:MAG: hypothetical protein L0210_07155 [Rhodospirillales bacterium]|nr:hypothetical protein [Rhodospirillales bacterium]